VQEREQELQALAAMRAEIEQRERGLADREAAVETARASAEESARALDARMQEDLQRRVADITAREAAAARLHAGLAARERELEEREQVAAAAAELGRAARLLSERGEAWARLAQLATVAPSEHP
jgi:hypothetical protein